MKALDDDRLAANDLTIISNAAMGRTLFSHSSVPPLFFGFFFIFFIPREFLQFCNERRKFRARQRDEEVSASETTPRGRKGDHGRELNFQRTVGKINIIQRPEKLD